MKNSWDQIKHKHPKVVSNIQIRKRLMNNETTWLVFDFSAALLYIVNEIGGEVLRLCDGERTGAEILNLMQKDYGVGKEVLEKDLAEFFFQLSKQKIVEISE